jgi:hypothetical protein
MNGKTLQCCQEAEISAAKLKMGRQKSWAELLAELSKRAEKRPSFL